MTSRVRYNELSSKYDIRYQQNALPEISKKLLDICGNDNGLKILEVGCGTGHWLHELSRISSDIFGLDYSIGMLKIASSAGNDIPLVNADANLMPFNKNTFDIIYCINAIHHFTDKENFITSAASLLKKGGQLAVFGIDHQDPELIWYIYKYFESTKAIDLKRFPPFHKLKSWMQNSNLSDITIEKTETIHTIKYGSEVLSDHFLTKAGTSQLALLSDAEYDAGLAKINLAIEKAKSTNEKIGFETRLNMYLIKGTKTGLS